MEGSFVKFQKNKLLYVISMLAGAFIAGRFGYFAVNAYANENIVGTLLSILFATAGAGSLAGSLYSLIFKTRMYFKADETGIRAKHGISSFFLKYDDIEYMWMHNQALFFRLKNEKYKQVVLLKNARELYRYIVGHIPQSDFETKKGEEQMRKNGKTAGFRMLSLVVLFLISVGLILLASYFTGDADPAQFDNRQIKSFLLFLFIEVLLWLMLLLQTSRVTENTRNANYYAHRLLSTLAEQNKNLGLSNYPNLQRVRYFYDFSKRMIFSKASEGKWECILEHYDYNEKNWISEAHRSYETEEAMHDDLEVFFGHILFHDEL